MRVPFGVVPGADEFNQLASMSQYTSMLDVLTSVMSLPGSRLMHTALSGITRTVAIGSR
jgi:hypothetical protein